VWCLPSLPAAIVSLSILLTTLIPIANAANNLNVSVSRNIEAFYYASQSLPVGSKPTSSMLKSATNKFCSEYNYIGTIGASERYFSVNKVSFAGKITKSSWAKNSDGEDQYEITINCKYASTFKNLPNSNWYVIDFMRDRFGAGSIMSHRMTPNSLQKAKWKISLNIDDEENAKWSPAFTFVTPKFTSEGCVELGAGPASKIYLSDPLYSQSKKGLGLVGEFEYFEEIAASPDAIPDYPTENDDYRYAARWDSTSRENIMYFWNLPDSGGYAKVAFLFETSSGSTTAWTVLLTITADCQIANVANLGRTYP
jgi:hypothetical protein